MIHKDYLTINNYDVTLAANGIEGFEKFNKSEFDLCILDIMMPFKDGLTLAKEIREVNEAIPLIFLTAKNLKDDVSAACNDFLKVLGYVSLGFSWLKMTKVSIDNSSKNKNFYEEKINTAKYFFDKILPRIDSHYHSAITGSESLMKAKFN